jgi:hypothetical protein
MNWFKGLGISVKVAALAFLAALAAMAVMRQKREAEKWKDMAVDIKLGNVVEGTLTAQAANTQAKLHQSRAKEIKAKAKERAKQRGGSYERINKDVSDILAQFRSS